MGRRSGHQGALSPIDLRWRAASSLHADRARLPAAAEDWLQLQASDYASLSRRLGAARLRQRLTTQVYHVAGEAHQQDLLLGLGRMLDLDVIVDRGARVTGMHRWGYRNFKDLRVVEHRIRHPRLPAGLAGLTLLQLSDLHVDLDPGIVDVISDRVRGLDYDLAVLTGDFRNTTHTDHGPSVKQMLALVEELRQPAYAVLGNHDFIEIVPPLERAGLRFLLNEVATVECAGTVLHLAGVDDPHFYKTHDLAAVMEQVPDDGFSVLLCHSPETYREAAALGFDVMLSGHTHGGQICLPGGIALIKVCDVPRRMLSGPWRYRDLTGYTSAGTGACGVALRYFCPPEVTLHRFER